MPTPDDWVYVYNFKQARQPLALRFPAGQGTKFQHALHQTWQIILKQLERRFSAETYHNRMNVSVRKLEMSSNKRLSS